MKKLVILLTMLLTLTVSAVCSAASGKVLDAEEALVAKFFESGNYKTASATMSAKMLGDWNETAYNNMKAAVSKDFGPISINRLRVIEKFDDADVLTYQVKGTNIPSARFIYIFVLNGDKPLLNDFQIILPKPQEEQAQTAEENK